MWLRIQLYTADGSAIAGASGEQRIGRDIYFKDGWHQRADTRIPPGEKRTLVHPPEFVAREKHFRHYERALAWEKHHITRLLRS